MNNNISVHDSLKDLQQNILDLNYKINHLKENGHNNSKTIINDLEVTLDRLLYRYYKSYIN